MTGAESLENTIAADRTSRVGDILRAVLGPVVLFLAVPQGILLRNTNELSAGVGVIGPFYVAFLALSVLLSLLACSSYRLRRPLIIAVSVFAVLALLFSQARPFADRLTLTESTALDVALVVAVLGALVVVPRSAIDAIFAAASGVFIVVAMMNTFTLHGRPWLGGLAREAADSSLSSTAANLPASASRQPGNVYHIVLDGFQREAFESLLRRDPAVALDDFVFYKNFKVAYPQTHFSLPSVLLGAYYDSSRPIRDWVQGSFGAWGLMHDLNAGSIGVRVFPYYTYFCPEFAATCDDQIGEAARDNRLTLVDLWFQAILPGSVRTVLNQPYQTSAPMNGQQVTYGFSLARTLGYEPGIPVTWHAVHSMRGFERFLESEDRRPGSGQYSFLHLMLPHGPYLYGPRCDRYPGLMANAGLKSDAVAYLDQAECGLTLVRTLADKLKRLGRYESSTIIVHADHGMGFTFGPDGLPMEYDGEVRDAMQARQQWPARVLSSFADALLLTKFAHQSGPMRTSDALVGALDIAPTVLRSVGLPADHYLGTPLQDILQGANPGPISHFSYALVEHGYPPAFSEFALQAGEWRYRRDVEVWGPTGTWFAWANVARAASARFVANVTVVGNRLHKNAAVVRTATEGLLSADRLAAAGISESLAAEFQKEMGEPLHIARYSGGFTLDLPTVPRRLCEILLARAHEVPDAVRAAVTATAAMEREVPIGSAQAKADCASQAEPMFVRIVTRDGASSIPASPEQTFVAAVTTIGSRLRSSSARSDGSIPEGLLGKEMGEALRIGRYAEGFLLDFPVVSRRLCEVLLLRAHEVPGSVRAAVTATAAMERDLPIASAQAAADCAGQREPMFVRIVTRD